MINNIEETRKQFRARCRAILLPAYQDADSLSTTVDSIISADQAFMIWITTLKDNIQEILTKSSHDS
jgi:hypothetical protein